MISSVQPELPKLPSGRQIAIVILAIIALLIFFSSCNSTKDLSKKKTETKTETEVKSITTRTITETAQENIKVDGDTLTKEADIADVIEAPIDFEDEDLKLIVEVNPVTNKIKATAIKKPKVIPVNIKRVTVEKAAVDTKTSSDIKEKGKEVHKETKTNFSFNYLWWLLLLLLIPIWKYRKQIFTFF